MKKYLMGSGAMLVGAGLMFLLMHGEVSADSRPEPFVCSDIASVLVKGKEAPLVVFNCRAGKLSCGIQQNGGISCIQSGGLFK
jgi:hypothetical protein